MVFFSALLLVACGGTTIPEDIIVSEIKPIEETNVDPIVTDEDEIPTSDDIPPEVPIVVNEDNNKGLVCVLYNVQGKNKIILKCPDNIYNVHLDKCKR